MARTLICPLATLGALAFFGLAGCDSSDHELSNQHPSAVTEQTPPPVKVNAVTVSGETVQLYRYLRGQIKASKIAEIRPRVDGHIQELTFTEGGHIQKGDILYKLDDALYRADLQAAEAALAKAEAKLRSARLQAQRSSGLRAMNAVSEEAHENATTTLQEAKANVLSAKAQVARSRILLDYAHVRAPISGFIGKSDITEGALVNANQATPLATIRTLNPVYLDVSQSSREYLEFRKALAEGDIEAGRDIPVQITLEDGSIYPHEGTLAFSEASADPSTATFLMRVSVPNPDRLLMPGMHAKAAINYAQRRDAILVPALSVQRNPLSLATANGENRARVMIINEEQRIEPREVILGPMIGQYWLVERGLASGEKVVTAGLQKIGPGVSVRVDASSHSTEE